MHEKNGVLIDKVIPGSIAEEIGVEPGDRLLSVQGQYPCDYIDFVYLTSDSQLEILIRKSDGEEWLLDIEREAGEDLGIQLEGIIYDELRECSNRCIFCFVDQMPRGLRKTLSLKDDDYRFSFLQGSYITLTDLSEEDFERIKKLKLSPLYISVHVTNSDLRKRMMGNKNAGKIMSILHQLKDANINFHTQIVLCPGINDGEQLYKSLEDLASLRPNLLSLAIVPVGLTQFRDNLYPLTPFTAEKAQEVFRIVSDFCNGSTCSKLDNEENYIYLADEFYLLTNRDFPPREEYHGFPQLENGVGLSRLVLDEMEEAKHKLPKRTSRPVKLLVVTGILGTRVLSRALEPFKQIENFHIDLLTVTNNFFGKTVTVAGLLTGQDLKKAIIEANFQEYTMVVLPDVVLNDNGLFIDGMSQKEFETDIPNALFVKDFTHLIDQLVEMNLMEVKK